MQWEYKFVHVRCKSKGFFMQKTDLSSFEHQTAELGRQGWELIQFAPPVITGMGKRDGNAIFKRRT